jgi:hypothetical protein
LVQAYGGLSNNQILSPSVERPLVCLMSDVSK